LWAPFLCGRPAAKIPLKHQRRLFFILSYGSNKVKLLNGFVTALTFRYAENFYTLCLIPLLRLKDTLQCLPLKPSVQIENP
jgi:hypothetical protein